MANESAKKLIGKWQLETSDDQFDAYMKAIGIGMMQRTIAKKLTPTLTLSVDPDGKTWHVKVESTFKNEEWTFVPGERFEQTTIDGRKFWCIVTVSNDGKVTEEQSNIEGDKSVPSIITRHVDEASGKLVAVCSAAGISSKRIYTRVN